MSRHLRPILQQTGMPCPQIWHGCHTSVDSGDLSQAPPKQSAVCSTCIIPAPPRTVILSGWPVPLAWLPANLFLGDSRPYAVIENTWQRLQASWRTETTCSTWDARANTLQSSALATLCRWRHCFMADQLLFMTHIWEDSEEEDSAWQRVPGYYNMRKERILVDWWSWTCMIDLISFYHQQGWVCHSRSFEMTLFAASA